MDDWDYSNRLLRRPRSTFNIRRLLPILKEIQNSIYDAITELREIVNWIRDQLAVRVRKQQDAVSISAMCSPSGCYIQKLLYGIRNGAVKNYFLSHT